MKKLIRTSMIVHGDVQKGDYRGRVIKITRKLATEVRCSDNIITGVIRPYMSKSLCLSNFFHGDGKGRNSKQIGDTNIYIETHYNNDRMVELYQIIKLFGYSKNDLKINIV